MFWNTAPYKENNIGLKQTNKNKSAILSVVQADLRLRETSQPQPPKCWEYLTGSQRGSYFSSTMVGGFLLRGRGWVESTATDDHRPPASLGLGGLRGPGSGQKRCLPWSQWTPYFPSVQVSQAVPLKPCPHSHAPVPFTPSRQKPFPEHTF